MPALCVDLERFLLHEDPLVRDSVGFHFFETWPTSEELAPLVLEACRRYGEEATLNLLSFGCRFPLSARGFLEALRVLATSRPPFVEQWVATAPLALARSRADLIRNVLSPRALSRLERRASLLRQTTSELWRRLEGHTRKLDDRAAAPGDWDEIEDLLEALSRLSQREAMVTRIEALEDVASPHLQWALVELSGVMRLHELGERLVDLLKGEEGVARAASQALTRIGSPFLVEAIGARYLERPRSFRRFAISVLKALKLERSEALLRGLVELETDPAVRGRIFDGLRFHFTSESEALLRGELQASTSWMIPQEIRKALYVFACLRGESGTELERWRTSLVSASTEEPEIYFHIPFGDPSGA